MPELCNVVNDQLQLLRSAVPALSAAKSAPAPGLHAVAVSSQQIRTTSPYPAPAQPHTVVGQHPGFHAGAVSSDQLGTTPPCPGPAQPQAVFGQHPGHHPGIVSSQQLGTTPPNPGPAQPHYPSGYQHYHQQTGMGLGQLASNQQTQYKMEFRCSPSSGRTYQVLVPVQTMPQVTPPAVVNPVRFEWRCNPETGVTYQVPVQQPVTPQFAHPPQPVNQAALPVPVLYEWRCNPVTGVTYQVPVQKPSNPLSVPRQPQQDQGNSMQPPRVAPGGFYQQNSQPPHQPLQQSFVDEVHERLKGITPLSEGGATKKLTKVIDFAKKCPVRWAKVAKADNINLPLYSYGAVTEIEAALSGRGDPMSDEVLLAKIRHLKNTFEVCCLNSSASDFCTYGWVIARDYAMKVEDEVEQRFVAWQDMMPGVRTQTLVLSQMENPRTVVRKKPGETPPSDPKVTRKERCPTFNSCTTEMKCDFEVSHPGQACVKKHECSWCRTNLQQGYKHQVWKCLKKQGAGH